MSESQGDPFNTAAATLTTSWGSTMGEVVERGDWKVMPTPTGQWWLDRPAGVLEKQTQVEGGLVMQRVTHHWERLGPFATRDEAQGYLDALEGK